MNLILRFNFSGVKTAGTLEEIKEFFSKYAKQYDIKEAGVIDEDNLLNAFIVHLDRKSVIYYLLIYDYDNIANNILIEHEENRYRALTQAGGLEFDSSSIPNRRNIRLRKTNEF
jgi:hypothetical protein